VWNVICCVGKKIRGAIMQRVFFLAALGIYLSLSPSEALADPFIVDQTNPWDNCTFGCGFLNIGLFSPIGQSFTPTLRSLDDVEIVVNGFPLLPSDLEVEIRAGTITGTILGAASGPSYTSSVHDALIAHFDFASSINLTPGNSYVIEVISQNPTMLLAFPGTSNPYPSGTAIRSGTPDPTFDFYFSEGPHVPEPSSLVLLGSAAGAAMWFHRRRQRSGFAK
jgi:hypothetical protein